MVITSDTVYVGGCGEPYQGAGFKTFLKEQRVALGGPNVDFLTFIPRVPRQAPRSNDCGLFALGFAEQIMMAPEDFVRVAEVGLLEEWLQVDPAKRRRELAAEISLLAR